MYIFIFYFFIINNFFSFNFKRLKKKKFKNLILKNAKDFKLKNESYVTYNQIFSKSEEILNRKRFYSRYIFFLERAIKYYTKAEKNKRFNSKKKNFYKFRIKNKNDDYYEILKINTNKEIKERLYICERLFKNEVSKVILIHESISQFITLSLEDFLKGYFVKKNHEEFIKEYLEKKLKIKIY